MFTIGKRALLTITLLSTGQGMALCAENPLDFRVSGIMHLGGDSYRALLEFPNGEKKTLAVGDDLESWKVTAISDSCISLSSNDKHQDACLAGSSDSQLADKGTTIGNAPKKPSRASDNLPSHFRKIDKVELLQALDSLTHAENMSELNETLLPLAGLSPDDQITQIDARNISSVQDAVKMLQKSVDENQPTRLTLINQDKQMNVIYLQKSE